MAEDRVRQLVQQGVAAAKAGQQQQAFEVLQRAVKIDPQNETAWLWLSSVARTDQERAFCLRQLYAINPNNELAIKGLKALGIDPTEQPKTAAAQPVSDVPAVTPDRLKEVQPIVEEFLKNYSPQQHSALEIEWTKKDSQRYGEATARRIQRTAYATGGLVAIVVFGLVGFLIFSLISSGGDDGEAQIDTRGLVTAAPSQSPTITPSPTVNPNTPVSPNIFSTPTPVMPTGMPRGNENVLPTATSIYPPIQQSQIRDVLPAFEAGDYALVSEVSAPFQTTDSRSCFAETYYYDAIGRAIEGGTSNLNETEALLEAALVFEEEVNFQNTCRDSALLKSALCFVRYQRAIASFSNTDGLLAEALPICIEAHQDDLQLVPAAQYLADVYVAQGNIAAAITTLEETRSYTTTAGLQPNNGNLNLLLELADLHATLSDFDAALEYVRLALYVDPVYEPALIKNLEVNALIAENAPTERDRQVRYGYVAVLAEEQYLSRYPGGAFGYVYIAEGRIREGNPERGIEFLERVLQVAGQPGVDPEAVLRAQSLRVEIAIAQGDWQTASLYLDPLLESDPDNLVWREWRKDIALFTEDYDAAIDDINFLVEQNPERADLVLQQAQILTQICQYESRIRCQPALVIDSLTPEFIAGLDELNAARANVYLAEATFAQLPTEEADVATLEGLVLTLQTSLAVEESPETYVLLGMVYSRLEQYEQALQAFEYVAFWSAIYEYPFADDVEDEIEAAQSALEDAA